jgi:hypothetical protein
LEAGRTLEVGGGKVGGKKRGWREEAGRKVKVEVKGGEA